MSAGPVDPLGFDKVHASMFHVEPVVLASSSACPAASSAVSKQPQAPAQDPLTTLGVPQETGEDEECLVDSQSICFSENPFLVANRKGKGRPPEERILSGPPVGYGRHGQLQPWLYNKASSLAECFSAECVFGESMVCHSRYLELTYHFSCKRHSEIYEDSCI